MKNIIALLITSIYHLISAPLARAQSFTIGLEDQVSSRVAINSDLGTFISRVFSAVIIVGGIATFIYMVYGGVQWITAGGEKDKVQAAREKITQAVIGLAVLASAWAVYKLIDYFFGIGIVE